MVVDERANALVFYTSGGEYQALMPLLAKLDTLPKQVSLDITIAEVTLQDEFKFGVEWALSRSEVTLTTQGAFGASAVGGLGLIVDGLEGPLTANFLNTNSLVKVLSNPTIMVRDGVEAIINVGSDISVVGATTQDPINGERQTTSSEYRKTGVDVTVTPTVNAQGIVVMEVSMTISNSLPNSAGASGNPDIFERLITTEVVAQSGQTIMLGGLISENYSSGGSGAPGLASIPLLGNLFKSKSDSTDRTELIMLITPQVQDSVDRWDSVKDDFQRGLKFLQME
jgi:general secretion pathway protein D